MDSEDFEAKDLAELKRALLNALKDKQKELASAKETLLKENSSKSNKESSETMEKISSAESTENSSKSNEKSSETIEDDLLDYNLFGLLCVIVSKIILTIKKKKEFIIVWRMLGWPNTSQGCNSFNSQMINKYFYNIKTLARPIGTRINLANKATFLYFY